MAAACCSRGPGEWGREPRRVGLTGLTGLTGRGRAHGTEGSWGWVHLVGVWGQRGQGGGCT